MEMILRYTDSWGHGLVTRLRYFARLPALAYLSVKAGILDERGSRRSILSVILTQIYYTGWEALPIVGILGLAVGGAVILNASVLSFLGTIDTVARLMIVVVVRELGPLSYIVFPRLLAGIVCCVCLTFYINSVALIGGYGVTLFFHDLSFSAYTSALSDGFASADLFLFLAKGIANGTIIFTVACYEGLHVGSSPHEIPQATTRAVLVSIGLVAVTTLSATMIFYLRQFRLVAGV
ncbi:MAG: ABC transporter permease [Deltaproteobacteria bacterium]|nr:ABC transporter permease [Deltaproteobacteria bacterium]